jgi:nifR3 family TIM-barrel protein
MCYIFRALPALQERIRALYAQKPVVLAPMEDVTDVVFRRLCRKHGATVAMTEFVNVEGLLRGCRNATRKIELGDDDALTAIQIYGANPERLAEAARFAESANPIFIDINCGCWVPKIAGRGAGAGWLREPEAMVAMARLVVHSVSVPVTVKTRIGLGPESHMPIVDLARRLEDAGVAALTIHCRTAQMGHSGAADWSWAAKAREVVGIPVLVNGDVRSAEDAKRAIAETGCAGVMVGRRAIEHPWIFREARALLDEGVTLPMPTHEERIALCREHLIANVERRGQPFGVHCTRRHLSGYLKGLPGAASLRQQLNASDTLDGCLAILDGAVAQTGERGDVMRRTADGAPLRAAATRAAQPPL